MKKNVLLTFLLVFTINTIFAQEKGRIRFDLQPLGWAVPQEGGGGLAGNSEIRYLLEDNMAVGIRFAAAALVKDIKFSETNENTEPEVGVSASYLATYDYFFNQGRTNFVPFVGGGTGYFRVANIDTSTDDSNPIAIGVKGKFGAMIRGGFDWGKFRMSADYNIVGKSDLVAFDGTKVGESKNGYFSLSIGFFLGGGKW